MDRTAETGVRWIVVRVYWVFIEPNAPAPPLQDIPGQRSGTHSYLWSQIDDAVRDARARGLNVALQLTKGPDWATGAPAGCGGDLGESNDACGTIATQRKDYFVLAWEDFCYNAVARYGSQVSYFSLWNEPNLRPNFNPEPPYDTIINEYVRLILAPGRKGVRTASPAALIVGPEITTLDTYWGNWLFGGIDPLLQYFGDQFDVLSLHSYDSLPAIMLLKMDLLRLDLSLRGQLGKKPVWLTEFNFRNGTCNTPDELIASFVQSIYTGMDTSWWTLSFYFALADGDINDCGFGLLHSPGYSQGAYREKPLYGLFKEFIRNAGHPRRRP